MILINNKRKYQFADSLPYVIEKYKEGGSGVTVRKKTLFIYTKFVTLATCIWRIYDVTILTGILLPSAMLFQASFVHIRISCNICAT